MVVAVVATKGPGQKSPVQKAHGASFGLDGRRGVAFHTHHVRDR